VFSFLSSLGKSGSYIVAYDFMSDDECHRLTDGFFPTTSQSSALKPQISNLKSQTSNLKPQISLLSSSRPNIIIVLMEGCGGQFTEIGGHSDITPRLNQLAREGVYFTNCYANSWRTDKGAVSVLSGYPAFPVTSVMKVPEKSRKLPSIAGKLMAEGYRCSFVYGGDINFTNMRSYVMSSGYSHLRWKADYSRDEQQTSQWGVRDDIVLQSVSADVKAEPADGHWMKTVLTLSSHEPWDVPTQRLSDPVYNAFNYLDECVGDFVDHLRQTPQWDNLLVIILPDHGCRYRGIDEQTLLYNHIPMIWVGGAVKEPCRVEQLCNQSDLAAILFGQMQLPHDEFTFSRDILSNSYQHPFAFHTWTGGMTMIDSTGFVAWDLDAQTFVAKETPHPDHLLRQGQAVLQLTSKDLVNR
jgi:phosphoglycerol transferase MdoB-like AlkP superfamily enzyme